MRQKARTDDKELEEKKVRVKENVIRTKGDHQKRSCEHPGEWKKKESGDGLIETSLSVVKKKIYVEKFLRWT